MENGNGNPTRVDGGQVPNTTLQLVITMDQMTGAVNVTGPIQNAALCYGMIELAKDAIRKFAEQNQSPIVRPGALSLVKH